MADFNSNDYFAKRFGRTTDESPLDSVMPTPPVTPKLDALVQASAEKVEALRQYSAEMEKVKAVNEGRTWGEFGKDVGLSTIQGVDSLAKLPAMAYDKATTGDWYGPETQSISKMSDEREKLKSAFSQAKNAQKNEVTKEAGEAAKEYFGDGTVGITAQVAAELGTSFWEAAKDPASIPEFLAQQAAQLGVMGKVGRGAEIAAQSAAKLAPKLAATKAGQVALDKSAVAGAVGFGAGLHGVDAGSDTMSRLMKLPDAVWQQNPEYLALAEKVGAEEAKQTIASQLASEATLKAAAVSAATAALPGGSAIERTLVGKKSGGFSAVPKAFTGEATQEGIEEGTGKYFGNVSVKEINTKQDLFEGVGGAAGQGAFYGGVLGGGIKATQTTAEAASNISFEHKAKEPTKNPQNEAVAAAISAGDISALTDPNKPSYAPEKAVAVLYETSKAADATPEVKQTNLEQAGKIVSDLEAQKAKIEEAYSTVSPEGIANYQTQLEATKVKLAEADPANVELQTNLQEQVTMLEEAIADASSDTAAATRLKSQLDTVNKQLEVASTTLGFFVQDTKTKDVDVAAQAAIINQPVDTQNTQAAGITKAAVDTVINLAMSNPERIDTKIAEELVANTSNALTTEQRNYLRALTTARIAENKLKGMKGVSKEIYEGSDNNIGIAQYRDRIGAALLTKNQKVAKDQLGLLIKFAKDHQAKATAAWEAMSKGKGNQIVRTTSGNWELAKTPLTPEQITENGGLTLNSQQLVDAIVTEADALTKVANELKAAYSVKFGTATAPVASPVPAATATPAASTESAPVAAKEAVPTEATTTVTQEAPASSVTTPEAETPTVQNQSNEGATEVVVVQPRVAEKPRNKRRVVDPSRDSLFVAIAKLGGMSTEALVAEGIDLNDVGYLQAPRVIKKGKNQGKLTKPALRARMMGFNLPLHRKMNGMSFDAMREAMAEYGYFSEATSLREAIDAFTEEMRGNPVFTSYAIEQAAQEQAEQQNRELEAEEAANEPSGFNDLSDTEQEIANAIAEQLIEENFGPEAVSFAKGLKIGDPTITQEEIYEELNNRFGNSEAGQPTTEGTTEGSPDGGNQEGNVDERILEETKTEEVKESRSAVLKGLQAKSQEGSAYQDRNLLGDFFTQVAQKTNEATARPLAVVKDFMSKVVAGEVKITDFIKNVDTLTVKQQAALRMFFKKASEWQKTINKNVIKGGKTGDNPKFYFQDLMQFLATELGDGVYGFEENVRTAISLAAYQTIIDEADQSPLNTPKRINSILLRDQDTQVTNEEYELLGRTGVRENVWRNAAGRIAVQALGLNTSNAPKDLLPRLESAFGAHIEKLLMDAEIIERQTLSKEQVTQLLGESNGRNKEQTAAYAATKFLRLAWTKEDTLPSNIQEIVDSNAGSSSILDKLFGTESALKYPSLEPIPFTQKTTGGTKDGIPNNIAEAIKEKQATPMYMRDDMWRLFNLVSDEAAYAMAGVVDTLEKQLHVVNRKSVEAKNNGLIREYQRYKEYVSSTLEQDGKTLSEVPFYLPYDVWVNQRVGIASTIFNPQTSKIHRFMAHYGSWKTQIDMSNQEAFDNFKLRVAEGMGVKTDKASNAQTLEGFDALFDPALNTDPKAKAKAEARSKAIDVLVSTVMEGNDMNQEQEAALVAGVKAGGENIHSLDGLMAMAQMRYAQANGRQSFETTLVGEVDGVANGPILSQFLMGAGVSTDDLLNKMLRGGFFTSKEEQNQYNLWKSSTGGLDLYEVTAQYIVRNVRKLLRNKEMAAITNRIEAFTGALEMEGKVQKEGRNVVKTTLTPLMFGSSVETSISRMGDKFVANIYERIENAANNSSYEDPAKIIDDINFLLASESTKGLNPRLDMEQLLEVELSPEQVKALKSAFNRTLGGALRTTIKQVFPVYLLQRDQLNRASQLTFDLFDSVYQGIRSEYIQELIQAEKDNPGTGIAVDGKGNPLHDLTAAQERTLQQRINKLIPMMHTSNSKMDGRLSTGVFLGENTSKLSTDPIYQSVVKFATPFKDTVGKKPAFSAYTNSQQQAFEGPGVRMPSQTTHSFDSGISHDSQLGREVTNIHDALVVGLNGFQDAAKAMNENTWKHLMNYSPMAEAFNTMSRMVSNLASFMEQETLSPASVANLKVILEKYAEDQKVPVDQVLEHMLTSLKMQAYQADHKKFGGLAQVVAVDQYAFEGGNYLVSEAERKEATNAQANLSEIVPEALLNQAKQITQQVLAADTKGVAVTKQDAGTSIPKDLMEDTDSLFELPAVEALQLLRMAVALPDSNMASLANQVLSAMTASGSNLAKAAAITLSKKQREALAVQLMALYNQVPENYFGALGVPYIESDPLLVNYFNKAPAVTVGRVLNMLQTRVKEQGNTIEAKANLVLIQELQKRADPSLTIRMITPSSYPQMALEKSATNARGWYVLKNDKQGIYVLSPDFVDSGLTVETLLHEITHSVVASLVDQEIQAKKANPNHSSEASKYVAELEMLRTKAAEYVATLSKEAQTAFNAAVGNTQEFITWGMTNTKFQNEVLKNITMESKTVKGLVSGMKAFIDNLIGALFKGASLMRKEVATNGLTVLVANVSGLFEQASMTNPRASNINQAQENTAAIDSFTTLDIHEALNEGKIDPTFDEHLRGLLAGIVEKLHGPSGAMAQAMKRNAAATPLDAWLKAKETEQATFASQVLGKYPASQQEAFAIAQVEATVKAALEDNAAETKVAYKQLYNLYTEARNKLKPSDFASQEQYDFVFKIEKNNGDRSDYLARFAALGLAHQEFNSKLQFSTQFDTRKLSDAKTFADKLQMLFEKILAYFNDKIARTYQGQNADQKLEALVSTLVDIEAKKRTLLKLRETEKSYLAPIEEGVKSLTEGLRYKVGQIAGSDFVKNSASGFVRGASGIARTIANDRVDQFMAGLGKLYDREVKGRQGIVGGLLREMTGYKEAFQVLLRAEKVREGTRKDIITNRSKLVLKTFAQGKKLSKESKKAITNVFLRTGFHTLTDHFTLPELASLVEDRDALNKAVTRFENSLTSPLKNQHIQQANTLGYYKATGLVQGFLMLNAHVIARMMGTQFNGQITEQEANQAEGNIKALVALYALRYTKQEHLNKAAEVFRTESQRTDGNGVEFTLALHKQLEQDSLEKVFKNNPTLMVHGYTPEILNSHTDIKIVDEVEGKELIDLGYSKGDMVARDPLDTSNKQQHIYVLRDGGLMPYLSGAISLSSMAAKGSKIYHGTANNKGTVASILNQKLKALSTNQVPNRDLSKEKTANMAPVYNENGDIVDWRYLMKEETKDDLLERDNRFENILGVLAASTFDKQSSVEQNRQVLQALYEDASANYADSPESYVDVGPASADPELREIWKMLPPATKAMIRSIWGSDVMKVRSDSLDIIFGYRKNSLADAFKEVYEEQKRLEAQGTPEARAKARSILNPAQQALVFGIEWALINYARVKLGKTQEEAENYAKKAAVMITKGERVWQELVRETKDIIVVKTGMVMVGNIWSNLSMLLLSGVSFKEMKQHHMIAMKAATAYIQGSEELEQYKTLLATGYTQGKEAEIETNILRLEDALARNPVKELIDAGLMPTIVEDVAADEDIYSYKSAFARAVDAKTSKLNPKVKQAAKLVYMSRDTKMYQGLSRITQLSDFVARYTLYQHLINRKNNPLSKEAAIQKASDYFVNYDIPMQRNLQYMDDMGLLMFTKYFLRIQKPLLEMSRENPARVLLAVALGNFMALGPIVLEGSALTRIGNNPLTVGALNYPSTLDDLATVNATMALVK